MSSENPPLMPAASLQAHVLVVVEDGAVSSMVEAALQRSGMTTVIAATVGHALALSRSGSCDAVVADSTMLLFDGWDALPRGGNRVIPIVVLLGSNQRHSRADLPDHVVLRVPFAEQDLLDAMAAAFGDVSGVAPALIDRDALVALWSDESAALFHDVSVVFVQEVDGRCAIIVEALAQLDRVSLKYQAHTLKGAATNVCAARLERAASWLETAAAIASAAMVDRAVTHLCSVARLTATAMGPVVRERP